MRVLNNANSRIKKCKLFLPTLPKTIKIIYYKISNRKAQNASGCMAAVEF